MVKSLIQKMREGLVITKDNKITVGTLQNTKSSTPGGTYEPLYTADVNTPTLISNIFIITDQANAGLRLLIFDIVVDGTSHEINPIFTPNYGPYIVDNNNNTKGFYTYEFTTPILVKNNIQIKVKNSGSGTLNVSKITGTITLISGDYDE